MVRIYQNVPDFEKRSEDIVKKRANPASLLFFFVLFKHKFRKTFVLSGIRTWIVRVEGEHADHLTTTTVPADVKILFLEDLQGRCILAGCRRRQISLFLSLGRLCISFLSRPSPASFRLFKSFSNKNLSNFTTN